VLVAVKMPRRPPSAAKLAGLTKVLLGMVPPMRPIWPSRVAARSGRCPPVYDSFVAPATRASERDAAGVSARDVMQVSEIIKVGFAEHVERPIYAGKAIQTRESKDAKKG